MTDPTAPPLSQDVDVSLEDLKEDHMASRDHASDAGSALDGWRPIATAPTDGAWVFLYWPTMPISFYPATGFNCGDAWELTALREYGEVFPTHWQPLPQPPVQQTASEGSRDAQQTIDEALEIGQ